MPRFILSLIACLTLASVTPAFADGSGSGSGSAIAEVSPGSGATTVMAGSATTTTSTVTTVTTIPDVNAHPDEVVSTLAKLYHSGTIPAAIILSVFFALVWLSTHVAWLQTGKRAAVIAAAVGAAATVIEPLLRGATPNAQMVGTFAIAAVLLYLHPKKPGEMAEARA